MIELWNGLLDGVGAILAYFFDLARNYGVAIILLTLLLRLLLLPLAIKQIRSMHAMQAIQPKVKELQRKHKGDRQKLNTEMMALYKEHGVNPLGGCLPLLLQFPVLIALFSVLNAGVKHIPPQSDLRTAIDQQETGFVGTNLLCSASNAGQGEVPREQEPRSIDCGNGIPVRIPYYVLLLAMIGTTYYQSKQMSRASPQGASQQQQMITRFMPVFFGFIGFGFPAGLVLYWTTTNLVQIAQQHFMLPRRPPAEEPTPTGKQRQGGSKKDQAKPGAKRVTKSSAGDGRAGTKGGSTAKKKGDGSSSAGDGAAAEGKPSKTSGARTGDARDRKKRRNR